MPKINYDEIWGEDPFHPCLNCGATDFYLDPKTELYTCCSCGETLVEPPLSDNPRSKPPKRKKPTEEDWV